MSGPSDVPPEPDFRLLFESAPNPCLALTPDLTIVAASETYLRVTMTRRDQIVGRGLFHLYRDDPDDAHATGRALRASLARVLQDRRADAMPAQKYGIRRPEAEGGGFEERYWSSVNSPVLGPGGEVAYIVHRVEDVTDVAKLRPLEVEQHQLTAELRMRAERMEAEIFLRSRELEEANRRRRQLETFIERAPVGLALFDRNMRYLRASRRWLEDCGIGGQEIVGKSHYDVFPDLPEHWKEVHRRGLAGESLRAEGDWVALDGKVHSIRWEIQPWGDAGTDTGGIIVFSEDVTERKAAEARLAHLAWFPEKNPNPIVEADVDGRVRYANPAALGLFPGIRRIGSAHPWLSDWEAVARSLCEGSSSSTIRLLTVGDRDFLQTLVYLPGERLVRAYGIDVTDRERAVEAVRCAAVFNEATMNSLGEGLYTIDDHGLVTFMNPAAEQILGWSFAELRGKKMHEMMHHHHRDGRPFPSAECAGFQVLTHGRPLKNQEDVFIHKDGTFFDVMYSIAPLRESSGRITGLVVVFSDITERKRAEESLRMSEERLAAVIDTAMDAIITVDEEQRVVLFNAAAEKTFGSPAREVIGTPLDRLLPERFREVHRRHIRTFGTTGVTSRSMASPRAIHGLRANGEEFPAEATISRASIGGQKLYTVILRDITERKQAEELARLYAQSKELDRLKTEFFANVSHELRTPLALILGPVRKLLSDGGLTEEERRDLDMVDRNARLLLKHVNHLLDLSKLDEGRMAAEYAEINLARRARVVASNFEIAAEELGVRYAIDVPTSLMAEVDPSKLERVLLNLLSNAFKFTPTGGSVRFTVRRSGDHALIEVADSGPGIAPALREAVFERFHQIESGSNGRFGGTGLGLAIVKEFVNLHRGRITVGQPAEGEGSVFTVEIPLCAPAGSAVRQATAGPDVEAATQAIEELAVRNSRQHPTEAAAAADAPVILLVEDNPDMNAFIAETLSPRYRVVSAFDGREGLERALALHPDLILSDVMMPHMSGEQMVREVRRRRELDHVPIVLLTAKADDELRVALLQEGAQDYLCKPVGVDELRARVGRLITDRRRAAEELERTHKLSGRLLEARDRERKRIADELNENVAQCLVALGWSVSRSRKFPGPDGQRILDEGLALLERVSADIRALSYILHPPLLEDIGLRSVIEWYVNGFTQRSGVEVTSDIESDLPRLPAGVELALFRIMEDALTNVRRHSGSKTVRLGVYRHGDEVVLEVADRGRGMPVPRSDGAWTGGIAEMRERARSLGGLLKIESDGHGTTVRAVLPVLAATSAAPFRPDAGQLPDQ